MSDGPNAPTLKPQQTKGFKLRPVSTILTAIALALLAIVSEPSQAADSLSAQTSRPFPRMLFSDGAVASPSDRCALGDVCATIAYPDGDQMIVLNEGAALCEPYVLRFVRMRGQSTLTSFGVKTKKLERCSDNFQNTWLTLDRGLVRLGIFQHPDGTLFLKFEPAEAPSDRR